MFVGIVIASQLVFIIASVTGARDLVEILARLILSEMGPLITGFIIIGRSCAATVADLGNAKVNGEIEPLKYLGIDVDDYFVVPRILSMVISQVTLALYFSAIMLLFGMLFSTLIYDSRFAHFTTHFPRLLSQCLVNCGRETKQCQNS